MTKAELQAAFTYALKTGQTVGESGLTMSQVDTTKIAGVSLLDRNYVNLTKNNIKDFVFGLFDGENNDEKE